jgi:hypothetical protein
MIKRLLIKELSNIPGWRTKRKIVIFESDDWGSIRMSSKESLESLHNKGLPVKQCHYNSFDSLESNDDISALLETLKSINSVKKPPVFTNVSIVGNPDFQKIKNANFYEYFYEDVRETLKQYPEHDNVMELTIQGIEEGFIAPVFHGREHLNVKRWMTYLQNGNEALRYAFDLGVTGISKDENGYPLKDLQAAFDLDDLNEIPEMEKVLQDGMNLFEEIYGFRSAYFVPTNGPFDNQLERTLHNGGVRYVNTGKLQHEPIGNGQYKKNIRFLGQRNHYGQRYITRNCFFEPSSNRSIDWVDSCLAEINIAFRWHKPAVISSHRVNYIGCIVEENRRKSLSDLKRLLQAIINKWPDVEFMSSSQLGDLISKKSIV